MTAGQVLTYVVVFFVFVLPVIFVVAYTWSFILQPFNWLNDAIVRKYAGKHVAALLTGTLAGALFFTILRGLSVTNKSSLIYSIFHNMGIFNKIDWRIIVLLCAINVLLIEFNFFRHFENFRERLNRD